MNSSRPRRSVLYMPGSNTRALEKAKTLSADCLILDLEDAVAPDAKSLARHQVADAVRRGGYGRRELMIRINGLDTEWGSADLEAAVAAKPDAILVPKISSALDVEAAAGAMKQAGAAPEIAIWAMMETPLAILNARHIAAMAEKGQRRLSCLVMGTNDLAKDSGAQLGQDRLALLAWLSTCVAAAAAYRLTILDGVYNNFRDDEGFKAECQQGCLLGMSGKTLIHPGQIEICNAAFSPSEEDVAWARKIVGIFDRPENLDKGVVTVEGRMVERLHADVAAETVAIADAIAGGRDY